jgi:hypothetical protein
VSRTRRLSSLVLALWILAGAAGAWGVYGVISRPANEYAERVQFVPKAGGYGTVHLSVAMLGTGRGPSGILMIVAGQGQPCVVTLPDLRLMIEKMDPTPDALAAGRAMPRRNGDAASVPLTEAELARALLGSPGPYPPEIRAEIAELYAVAQNAASRGLPTRPVHFELKDAEPWVRPWRGRGLGRGLPLVVLGVLGWGAGAAALVRRVLATP